MARDAVLRSDDRISIVLDTYRDQRNAFYFSTNPAGALVDGLVFANGQSNNEWDAIWTVRTRRTGARMERGVRHSVQEPELSLRADGLGIQHFSKHSTESSEEDRWSGASLQTQFFQVSEAGEITNLEGLTQGIGLDVRPFMAGRWLHTGVEWTRQRSPANPDSTCSTTSLPA